MDINTQKNHKEWQYTTADLSAIRKNALLWTDILSQTSKKRLQNVVRRHLRSVLHQDIWGQRLCFALCEIGTIIRELKHTQKAEF